MPQPQPEPVPDRFDGLRHDFREEQKRLEDKCDRKLHATTFWSIIGMLVTVFLAAFGGLTYYTICVQGVELDKIGKRLFQLETKDKLQEDMNFKHDTYLGE